MRRSENSATITAIQNGQEDVLFSLTRKYYPSARRWLRQKGIRDIDTPAVFSRLLVKVFTEIKSHPGSANIDFESFFFNALKNYSGELRAERKLKINKEESPADLQAAIACYTILDEQAKQILSARYAENMSFEQIASRFNFSNPVIAQFEVNKAYVQLAHIVNIRLNPSA
jgi:hypothetical protein